MDLVLVPYSKRIFASYASDKKNKSIWAVVKRIELSGPVLSCLQAGKGEKKKLHALKFSFLFWIVVVVAVVVETGSLISLSLSSRLGCQPAPGTH